MDDDVKLILASGSPRRVELLDQIGVKPDRLMPMDLDESPGKSEHPKSLARRLAGDKAKAARKAIKNDPQWGNSFILAADTVVILGKIILGKPLDENDAKRMLEMLSGNTHMVATGFTILDQDGAVLHSEAVFTEVTFKNLAPGEIDGYIKTGEPMDKAGAYAIQGIASQFVKSLNGSYSGVMGLPLYEVARVLATCGIETFK